jgi:O-antigen ligase
MALALVCIVFSFFYQPDRKQQKKTITFFCLTVSSLCAAQALCGILQYAKILPAAAGFRITGSFDNSAGFAACLCAGFPFLFYFIRKKYNRQRCFSFVAIVQISIAVVLSGSRAGIMSLFAAGIAILFYRLRMKTGNKIIIFSLAFVLTLSGLYFLKKDSADGRLLIWRCSWEMIKDKPLLGHGYGGFKANYMNYQADYFTQYPDSQYIMLADNVSRPFNEYILLLSNYGFVGFVLFLAVCWFLLRSFLRCRYENMVRIAGSCLLSIAVFAFFSYPLRYPFVWIMLILSMAIIIYKAKYPIKIPGAVVYPALLLMIPAIILSGVVLYQRMTNEMLWNRIANKSLLGKTEQVLPMYEHLHRLLNKNELFLYNYAAELNVIERHEESLQIARECEILWADYDLQMLMAGNYQKLQQYAEAERYYQKAANMCPVKFMPLYELAKLYDATGDRCRVQEMANLILNKRVKIPSSTIQSIKSEMQQMIYEEQTNKTAQDNVSEKLSP